MVEDLPSIDGLERNLADIEQKADWTLSWAQSMGESSDELRERLVTLLDWRRFRRSGPKCLICGSESVIPFPIADEEDMEKDWLPTEHPGCGGTLEAKCMGMTLIRRWPSRYTPEGDPIDGTA